MLTDYCENVLLPLKHIDRRQWASQLETEDHSKGPKTFSIIDVPKTTWFNVLGIRGRSKSVTNRIQETRGKERLNACRYSDKEGR